MKKITLLLIALLFISCNGENYKNKKLSFAEIDKNGGITFLDLKIDENGKVSGTSGYNIYEQIKDFVDIEADLEGTEIKGTAYDENKDETKKITIKISENFAEYNEEGKNTIILPINKNINQTSKENTDENNEIPTCNNERIKEQVIEIVKQNLDFVVRARRDNNHYSIENIFTTEKNDELKSCECEGQFTSDNDFGVTGRPISEGMHKILNISYKAQLNEEGEFIVKVKF